MILFVHKNSGLLFIDKLRFIPGGVEILFRAAQAYIQATVVMPSVVISSLVSTMVGVGQDAGTISIEATDSAGVIVITSRRPYMTIDGVIPGMIADEEKPTVSAAGAVPGIETVSSKTSIAITSTKYEIKITGGGEYANIN